MRTRAARRGRRTASRRGSRGGPRGRGRRCRAPARASPPRGRAPPPGPGGARASEPPGWSHPFARRSVSRTDQPRAAASRARLRRASLPCTWRIARPWPSLSSPEASSSSTSSGRSSRRMRLEIAERLRPRRRASSSFESPRSSTSAAHARASSTGLRSSRATFSISAVCSRSRLVLVADRSPGRSAGRPRGPPASGARRRSARSGRRAAGRTISGWTIPASAIEAARLVIDAGSKRRPRLLRVRPDQLEREIAELGLASAPVSGRIAARPRPIPLLRQPSTST